MTKETRNRIYHVASVVFIVAALCFSIFRFDVVFFRVLDAFKDLGTSIAYFCTAKIFGEIVTPTVVHIPEKAFEIFPYTWEEFLAKLETFWGLLWDDRNFFEYLGNVVELLLIVMSVILPIVIILALLGVATWLRYRRSNNNTGKDTTHLSWWYRLEDFFQPLRRFVRAYRCGFLKRFSIYKIALVLIWLYNFNFFTIVIEVIAFVFYVAGTPSLFTLQFLECLYSQLVKLILDLSVVLQFIPVFMQVIIGFWIFHSVRCAIADKDMVKKLEKTESVLDKYRGTVAVVGFQRSFKTTNIVQFAKLEEKRQRKDALKAMKARKKQFPFFPWANLEKQIRSARKKRKLINKAQCRRFIRELRDEYYRKKEDPKKNRRKYHEFCVRYEYHFSDLIFGYKTDRYPMTYDDGRKIVTIWEALEAYAQLYFIFTTKSLTWGNLSIRSDYKVKTKGNTEKWDFKWWRRSSKEKAKNPQYCHIGDKDALRLGKTMVKENPRRHALEFGVWVDMEFAKEVGNQKTTEGLKKDANECNRKNDGLSLMLKIITHMATVDGVTFFRAFFDDHRESSFAADIKDLFNILRMVKADDPRIVLPCFAFEEGLGLLLDKIYSKIEGWFSYNRGDETLFMYLLKRICMPYLQYCDRLKKRYSVRTCHYKKWDGAGEKELNGAGKVYIVEAHTFDTFATDGLGEYFYEKAIKAELGVDDVPTFKDVRMSLIEMLEVNSHVYNELAQLFSLEEWEKAKKQLAEWYVEAKGSLPPKGHCLS